MSEKRVEELTKLLREARDSVERDMDYTEIPDQISREHTRLTALLARIDAALKENDTPFDFEFAEGEGDIENAEWDGTDEGFLMAYPDSYTVMDVLQVNDYYRWSVAIEREASGRAETLQEAKEAAIKATRRIR